MTPTTRLLDAHVWLAAEDVGDPAHMASRALVDSDLPLAALDLTLLEVANVPTVRWKDPEAGARLAAAVEVRCGPRLLMSDSSLIAAATELAAQHGLTVYDAAYAAAAQREGYELISGDSDLVVPGLATPP